MRYSHNNLCNLMMTNTLVIHTLSSSQGSWQTSTLITAAKLWLPSADACLRAVRNGQNFSLEY